MAFDKKRAQVVALLRERGAKATGERGDPFEFTLVTAIGEASEGRPEMLATILRSDAVLTKVHRGWLADFVDGRFDRPRHRPQICFPLLPNRSLIAQGQ